MQSVNQNLSIFNCFYLTIKRRNIRIENRVKNKEKENYFCPQVHKELLQEEVDDSHVNELMKVCVDLFNRNDKIIKNSSFSSTL